MNIAQELKDKVKNCLGWDEADSPVAVRGGRVNIIECGEKFCIATCTDDDAPYIEAMHEMILAEHPNEPFVIKIIKAKGKANTRLPRGKGFGDKAWRWREGKDGTKSLEVSFASKPQQDVIDKLKSFGFKWSHINGVWYIKIKDIATPDVGTYIDGLCTKVDDVKIN